MACVSELNKCFAFKDKCLRTIKTLKTYLDISSSEEKEASESDEEEQPPVNRTRRKRKMQEQFDHIEVIDSGKIDDQHETEMVLELNNLLNPTSSPLTMKNDNSVVYIIENVTDNQENTNLVAASTENDTMEIESTGSYNCEKCKMDFVRKKNFENHMKKYHNQESDDDEPLSKRLRVNLSRAKENDHLKTELIENPDTKKCKTCGALYMNEKSLRLHERRNACQQPSYECDVCKKIFTDQILFTEHTKTHPQQLEEEETKVEVQSNDADRKYQCDLCPKAFKMSSTLKDHRRVHTGDKPFKCTICNRGFSQNTNLKMHIRRHTQMKPFKCTFEKCQASFVSKSELDSHSRKHSGEHPFACDQCTSKFTTSSSLVKHKRIHSGERPYQCEFCPMRFTALGTLNNHTRTHTGERPHSCQFCDRKFTQRSDLATHERTHTGQR